MTDLAQEKPRTGEEPDIDLDEEDEAGDGQLGICIMYMSPYTFYDPKYI